MNTKRKIRRKIRTRAKVQGTTERPRLSIHRSNKFVYAQLIDDGSGKTVVGASQKEVKATGSKTEIAKELGKLIAQKAIASKVKKVVFDRGSYAYHGRVKALAEGAREGGLEF
jgi:large subunit ribosomal protein L18